MGFRRLFRDFWLFGLHGFSPAEVQGLGQDMLQPEHHSFTTILLVSDGKSPEVYLKCNESSKRGVRRYVSFSYSALD